MSGDLKAYSVQDDYDDAGCMIFAKSNVEARRLGARRLDTEFGGLRVERAPWADQYAPGPVPRLALIDVGWWFECHGCGVRIDSDCEAHDEDEPRRLEPVEHGNGIWCTTECRERDLTNRAAEKTCCEKAKADLAATLLARFPGVTLAGEPHAYSTKAGGVYVAQQCVVYFRFPGCTIGDAIFRYDRSGEEPVLMVCAGDHDAWKAWRLASPPQQEKME